MRTFLLCGLICGIYFLGVSATVYGAPFGGGCECDSGCGSGCRGGDCGWDSGCDCGHPNYWPSGASCDPCNGNSCCDSCRPMTCHDKTYCGPLTPLFAMFTRDSWCGSGCGERYWGDFYGNPPDCCDPCDRCGNYTGRGCGGCGECGGCNSCGNVGGNGCNCGGRDYGYGGVSYGSGGNYQVRNQIMPAKTSRMISQGDRIPEQVPTPAARPKNVK
jgi:hypothetical protein